LPCRDQHGMQLSLPSPHPKSPLGSSDLTVVLGAKAAMLVIEGACARPMADRLPLRDPGETR
jgi:hypothetical protein